MQLLFYMVNFSKKQPEIQLLDAEYDVNTVINLIDEINYPDAANIKKYFYGIW